MEPFPPRYIEEMPTALVIPLTADGDAGGDPIGHVAAPGDFRKALPSDALSDICSAAPWSAPAYPELAPCLALAERLSCMALDRTLCRYAARVVVGLLAKDPKMMVLGETGAGKGRCGPA